MDRRRGKGTIGAGGGPGIGGAEGSVENRAEKSDQRDCLFGNRETGGGGPLHGSRASIAGGPGPPRPALRPSRQRQFGGLFCRWRRSVCRQWTARALGGSASVESRRRLVVAGNRRA